jgi:hypothetical protein
MSTLAARRRAKIAWKRRNPQHEKDWTRTLTGRLSRCYTNLQCRCRTLMAGSPRHYGLPYISRQEFVAWAGSSNEYKKLFKEWEISGFLRKLTPTIDRVDPAEGYIISNMEFVTQGENSRRNNNITWRKRRSE